jgi:hypothetical protein
MSLNSFCNFYLHIQWENLRSILRIESIREFKNKDTNSFLKPSEYRRFLRNYFKFVFII